MSGCYATLEFADHWNSACALGPEYLKRVTRVGAAWGEGVLPREIREGWQSLLRAGSEYVHGSRASWRESAFFLMAAADEASAGIGYINPPGKSKFGDYVLERYRQGPI